MSSFPPIQPIPADASKNVPAAAETSSASATAPAVVLTLAGLSAMAALATNIVLPSLPGMAAEFAVSEAAINGSLGLFLAVFALTQLVVGPWSDRIGRRPVVLAGLVAFLIGSVVCALAPDLSTLLSGRAIQAAGAASASVLARAIARDLVSGPALVRLMGLIMVVMSAAPGFSPLLGGLLDQALGWRAVFVMLALAALLAGVAHLHWIGETHGPDARQARSIAAVAREYAVLLKDRRFLGPALAAALVMGALYALFGATPIVLAREFGLGPLGIGVFFGATVFVVFGAGTAAPRLVARFGAVGVLVGALIVATVGGVLLLAVIASGQLSLVSFSVALCVFLAGMATVLPVGTARALTPFAAVAGQASALLGFLQMACAALAATAATSIALPRSTALGLILAGLPLLGWLAERLLRAR